MSPFMTNLQLITIANNVALSYVSAWDPVDSGVGSNSGLTGESRFSGGKLTTVRREALEMEM